MHLSRRTSSHGCMGCCKVNSSAGQVKEDVTEVETYDVKFKSAGPAPEVLEATLMVLKVRLPQGEGTGHDTVPFDRIILLKYLPSFLCESFACDAGADSDNQSETCDQL